MTDDEKGADENATEEESVAEQADPDVDERGDEAFRVGEFGVADDVVGEDRGDSQSSEAFGAGLAEDPSDDDDARSGADADAPLSSLASSVEERRGRPEDRPDDELFSEESVPEIDTDVVWDRLEADEPPELPDEAERDVRVVEKRSYCEQCPFFSEPPEVSCTHDGTEILELVDMDHFRVVDCPKVREDERLERL